MKGKYSWGAVEGEYVTIEKGLVDGEKIVVEGAQHLNVTNVTSTVIRNNTIQFSRR